MGNNVEMDKRNNQMTNSRNVFCRFFRTMVMVHKIPHARLTEWNNKRKHKALASGIYLLSILAAAGQDGYVHLESGWQKAVFYGVSVLAVLLMLIHLGFSDDKKICKEVRQELRERPRYWKRAVAVYWAAVVAAVVAVNVMFL